MQDKFQVGRKNKIHKNVTRFLL